jgi:hypothetical protein
MVRGLALDCNSMSMMAAPLGDIWLRPARFTRGLFQVTTKSKDANIFATLVTIPTARAMDVMGVHTWIRTPPRLHSTEYKTQLSFYNNWFHKACSLYYVLTTTLYDCVICSSGRRMHIFNTASDGNYWTTLRNIFPLSGKSTSTYCRATFAPVCDFDAAYINSY